jgi:hypothetical protein
MTVYLVVVEDRHFDVDVLPFSTLDAALAAAEHEVDRLCRHPENIERLGPNTADEDWYLQIVYSCEGDSVSVISREVKATADA